MKIVIFGSGKIGRAFIGQVFGMAGYEVVFVDIDRHMIDLLNQERQYRVEIRDRECESMLVGSVRGVHADDLPGITREVEETDLVAVSVGLRGLPAVARSLASALESKYRRTPGRATDIILAENMRDASTYFAGELATHLPEDFPLDTVTGLIETSIGKMVPVIPEALIKADPLAVYAEAYNFLIVDGEAFRNPVPDIPDLEPKKNIRAWVDRKSFLHNLGHAMAAYFGSYYLPGLVYMYEVLSERKVEDLTLKAMFEAGEVLKRLHPDEFTRDDLEIHISDLVNRFKNPHLGDTVHRVGCDLKRKLGAADRIATPIRFAMEFNMPCQTMLEGYICALTFAAADEKGRQLPGDIELKELYQERGLEYMLVQYSGLDSAIGLDLSGESSGQAG